MKRIILIVLSISIFLGLYGCKKTEVEKIEKELGFKIGDTGGLSLPISDKNEEITWSVTTEYNDANNSWLMQKLRAITGVNVQLRVVPASTAKEKVQVWIASKDLPDILGQGLELREANDLGRQGAFAAVSDYINMLPNFKSTFVDNPENDWIFKSYKANDGKLYGFYGYDWNRDVNTGMTMYRKDIFDKHGIPLWRNDEEFYSALKKLKEIYPDSTPYTIKAGDSIFQTLSYGWGIVANKPYYDEKNKIWKYSDTDPAFKNMLDFLRKLYDEKLIDPEFLTLTQAAWTAKMTQRDKAFVTTDWIGRMEMFKAQTADTVPEYDLRFAYPIGPNGKIKTLSQLCWARYVANNKKAETAFKLLDFVLSPAGAELITMGVENETYTLDENGKAKYIEFPDKIPSSTDLAEKYGMFLEGMYLRFDRRSAYFNFTEREQEAQDFAKDKNNMEPLDPELSFTVEEEAKLLEYQSKLETAGKEFATKYILTTETGDSAWQNWLQKAKQIGVEEIVKIYNDAQKRFDEE